MLSKENISKNPRREREEKGSIEQIIPCSTPTCPGSLQWGREHWKVSSTGWRRVWQTGGGNPFKQARSGIQWLWQVRRLSLSLLWGTVTFLCKAFPLLLLCHLLDVSLISVTRTVCSPTRVPASRKRERVDTPLTLKALTQKLHTIFWLTSNWPELSHMATPHGHTYLQRKLHILEGHLPR